MINENAKPVTPDEIKKVITGKRISYEDISRESSETPSTWYVDKEDPSGVITFKQPYEIVSDEINDKGLYELKIQLDDKALDHNITLSKNSKPTQSVPNGLVQRAIKKLNLK